MESFRRTIGVVLPRVILAVALVMVAGSVLRQWDELGRALHDIGPFRVMAATVLAVLGVATTAEVWRCSVAAATGPLPRTLAYRVFWVSQAGKYVPGAIWPFVVQALAARRLGVEVRGVLMGGSVFLAVHTVTALLASSVGVALIPGTTTALRVGTWTATALACAVLGSGVWHHIPRLWGGDVLPRLDARSAVRAFGWMCMAWLLYGAGTALLIAPLMGRAATPLLLSGTAASAIGWVVGLVVVVAPAGVGARELAMAWVLGSLIGAEDVLAVVLLTRLALLIGDLGLALTGVGALRELRADSRVAPNGQVTPDSQLPPDSQVPPDSQGGPQPRPPSPQAAQLEAPSSAWRDHAADTVERGSRQTPSRPGRRS